jgi:hypothetical protein
LEIAVAAQLMSLKNKTVLVSIPTLFGDAAAHQCQIAAAEPFGIWLVSNELSARVLPHGAPDQTTAAPAIFVPFAQIAALVPVEPVPNPSLGLKPAAAAAPPAATASPSAKAAPAATPQAADKPTPDKSKPKRSR